MSKQTQPVPEEVTAYGLTFKVLAGIMIFVAGSAIGAVYGYPERFSTAAPHWLVILPEVLAIIAALLVFISSPEAEVEDQPRPAPWAVKRVSRPLPNGQTVSWYDHRLRLVMSSVACLAIGFVPLLLFLN